MVETGGIKNTLGASSEFSHQMESVLGASGLTVKQPGKFQVFKTNCATTAVYIPNAVQQNSYAIENSDHCCIVCNDEVIQPVSVENNVANISKVSTFHLVNYQLIPRKDNSLQIDIYKNQPVSGQSASRDSGKNVTDISKNHFNKINHEIHDCLWCPCILYALFICSVPALLYMHKSDKRYQENILHKAKLYARIATFLYGLGFASAIIIYFLIGYFVYYLNFMYKSDN